MHRAACHAATHPLRGVPRVKGLGVDAALPHIYAAAAAAVPLEVLLAPPIIGMRILYMAAK
jgi:hypothetical protein